MLISCWSVKGGSGTSVVAASLALVLARSTATAPSRPSSGTSPGDPVLLVDLDGDAPAVLGLPEPAGPGVVQWLDADAEPSALEHLAIEATPGLLLVPRGKGPLPSGPRVQLLAQHLAGRAGPVVVDGGSNGPPPRPFTDAGTSVIVLRPCYLALRRAAALDNRPDVAVLIDEPGRVLRRSDVESTLGVKVRAHLELDPAVARAVDAGLLAGRLPSQLAHGLRRVV